MKLIIAGSRTIKDWQTIFKILDAMTIKPTEVVSGGAAGVDMIGEMWAAANKVPIKRFPADWNNLTTPDAIPRPRKDGSFYNKRAGYDRNIEMAKYATGLIVFWDGQSKGTKSMIEIMRTLKKTTTVIRL